MTPRLLLAPLLILAAPLAPFAASGAPLSGDAGPFTAQGSFSDEAGHVGQWHAAGMLAGGAFTGSLVLELVGVTRTVTLVPAQAYRRSGTCVLRGTAERNWVELRGPCDDAAIGPGTVTGAFDGHALKGRFKGTLAAGATEAPAPVATAAPKA